jgi:hypothetical protein
MATTVEITTRACEGFNSPEGLMLGIFDIEELCEKKYVSWDGK